MAMGAVPTSFKVLNNQDYGLGFGKSMDFVRILDSHRVNFGRKKVLVIKNSNPSSEIAEMQPASEGSPLLGNDFFPVVLLFKCEI